MIEFKGFDDWTAIFKGGKQTDSMGREHDGDAIIDKAIANFNAEKHEPPAVVGHPKDNAPAFGWVEGLKKEGNVLLAKFKQVQPDFADMVKAGLFKKRSAAFYPDGSLRHVGFLGAAPPAVKGLPDMAFTEDGIVFEFVETQNLASLPQQKEDNKMTFKDKIKGFLSFIGVDVSKVPDEALPDAPPVDGNAMGMFTEADIAAATKKAAEDAAKKERETVTAEFAEKQKTAQAEARRKEISTWCDSMVASGKLTPAMVKYGVPEMLSAFAEKDDAIEFGETKEKTTLFDRFKGLFETETPKVIEFKEIATRGKDAGGAGGAGQKLTALTRKKMDTNKDLSYSAAFAEVQTENPDLIAEYQQELAG